MNITPWSPSQVALIRRTVARDCNDLEFDLFCSVAQRTGLDPIRRQIMAMVFSKDKPDKRQMAIVTTIDGLRAIAERTGAYRPDDNPPEYVYDDALKSDNNPHGIVSATVRAYKFAHGGWHRVAASAYWDEFFPTRDDAASRWRRMGRLMIAKCAEAQALRRGWQECAGLYESAEMQQAEAFTASELAARAEAEDRLARIGGKNALALVFDRDEPIELVPIGQLTDRVTAWARACDSLMALKTFRAANGPILREFWAIAPTDALELKRVLEAREAELEAAIEAA